MTGNILEPRPPPARLLVWPICSWELEPCRRHMRRTVVGLDLEKKVVLYASDTPGVSEAMALTNSQVQRLRDWWVSDQRSTLKRPAARVLLMPPRSCDLAGGG